jgi:hypothetical protein
MATPVELTLVGERCLPVAAMRPDGRYRDWRSLANTPAVGAQEIPVGVESCRTSRAVGTECPMVLRRLESGLMLLDPMQRLVVLLHHMLYLCFARHFYTLSKRSRLGPVPPHGGNLCA